MNYLDRRLIREQLDKKISKLKDFSDLGVPIAGWVKSIREALGLSARQLAKRVGIDQSRLSRLEGAEKTGQLKVSSLIKIADGLGMRFVYGFVPSQTLEEMIQDQAHKIARERMNQLNDTMALELQELSKEEKEKALNNMIEKILIEEPKELWDK